eukprot:6756876-Lingulodinium_polyedra.AAC.1
MLAARRSRRGGRRARRGVVKEVFKRVGTVVGRCWVGRREHRTQGGGAAVGHAGIAADGPEQGT